MVKQRHESANIRRMTVLDFDASLENVDTSKTLSAYIKRDWLHTIRIVIVGCSLDQVAY